MTKKIEVLEMFEPTETGSTPYPNCPPKKVAECDITEYSIEEIKLLLEIQEMLGRTWEYKQFKEKECLCLPGIGYDGDCPIHGKVMLKTLANPFNSTRVN